jgi:hypothetical protein
MLLGIGVIAVVAVALLNPALRSSGSAAERWETVRHRGMSIDLPATFEVTTDVEDFRQAILELDPPNAEDRAETYRRFPEFFVLAAIDLSTVDGSIDGWSTTVVVHRFPAPRRSVAEAADLYESSASESGFEVVDRHEEVLDGRYEAIRFEFRGTVPPFEGASIDYVIQAGAEVWVLEFGTEPSRFSAEVPTFDRIASTIRLP